MMLAAFIALVFIAHLVRSALGGDERPRPIHCQRCDAVVRDQDTLAHHHAAAHAYEFEGEITSRVDVAPWLRRTP